MENKIISPSVLDVDKEKRIDYINQLIAWGVDNVHYDVMDNIFVPNSAIEVDEIINIKKYTQKHTMNVHLMVKNVWEYIEKLQHIADYLIIHIEALTNEDILKIFKTTFSCKLGIALNPDTDLDKIKKLLPYVDLVLVMSVQPGFGGQKFKPEVLEKVTKLLEIQKVMKYDFLIEMDGGINNTNIAEVYNAGVNWAVVGSYLAKNFTQMTVESLAYKDGK